MIQSNIHNFTPPPANLQTIPLLQKAKNFYQLWYGCYKSLPKEHRYTLGSKIDNLLTEIIEATSGTSFSVPSEKQSYLKIAILKNDTVKIFLNILWETKSLNNEKYLMLSEKLNEIGRMLGGWNGQLLKQNSSIKK